MNAQFIRVYATIPCTKALGPYTRFAIWFQGCKKRCPGCMTPTARAFDGGSLIGVDSLVDQILSDPIIEGVTISGGEPFEQSEALSALTTALKAQSHIGIIVYSGYTLDELRRMEDVNVEQALSQIDLLIDGPYIRQLDDGLSLRGSSNQAIRPLTNRYESVIKSYYGLPRREAELHLLNNDILLVGIAGKDTLNLWKNRRTL
jgi:anaerobic ribonucleoside-triphosphate reductase activating protein